MKDGDNEDQNAESLARILDCEPNYDACVQKVRDLIRENATLQLATARLKDAASTIDFEQRASRETTLRLSGELNKAIRERDMSEHHMKQVLKEAEKRRIVQEEMESKSRLLEDRVKSLTSALGRAHLQAEQREANLRRISENQPAGTTKNNQQSGNSSTTVSLMSESEHKALQDFIKFIRHFMKDVEEKSVSSLLNRAKDFIVKADEDNRATRSELSKAEMLENKLREKSAALSASEKQTAELSKHRRDTEAIIKSLREETTSTRDWMTRLADALKLEEIASDPERALLMDAIAARVKVLISGESEKSASQRARLNQMQQKSRDVKERNDSLEVQLTLLRKRLAELEELRQSTAPSTSTSVTSVERERRRLARQLEQTRAEASALQADNNRLKAEAQANSQQALAAVGSSSRLQSAECELRELRQQRDHQREEISSLRRSLTERETTTATATERLQATIDGLRAELDCVKRSELQLLEFRSVIASLLDMDYDNLAVPDFEIVHRLENQLLKNQFINAGDDRHN